MQPQLVVSMACEDEPLVLLRCRCTNMLSFQVYISVRVEYNGYKLD